MKARAVPVCSTITSPGCHTARDRRLLAAPSAGEVALNWEQMRTIITSLFLPQVFLTICTWELGHHLSLTEWRKW